MNKLEQQALVYILGSDPRVDEGDRESFYRALQVLDEYVATALHWRLGGTQNTFPPKEDAFNLPNWDL